MRRSISPGCYLLLTSIAVLVSGPAFSTPSKPPGTRVADYSIDVRFDPQFHSLDAREILVWHNATRQETGSLYFHLYLNAFKSSNTAFMTESGREVPSEGRGWIDIQNLVDMRSGENLTDQIGYASSDVGNLHDSTVMVVRLGKPVRPGDSITVSVDFHEKLPEAGLGPGWSPGREFCFVSGWFPKIGVFRNGRWNCHQFHASGGSFADFGLYDVKINVPMRYVVGATGMKAGESMESDGTITYHYVAPDVNGFAWVASPDLIAESRSFECQGLPETKVILLLQPEHHRQAGRYFAAVDSALKYFGLWYGPYPYGVLTVVDPACPARPGELFDESEFRSGMDYPMLVSAGTSVYALQDNQSLERAIIDGVALQYWSSLVAANGVQDAWLAYGMSTYSAGKVLEKAYGGSARVFRIGGVYPVYMYPLTEFRGVPVAAIMRKVWIHEPYNRLPLYLHYAKTDAISELGYKAIDPGAYRVMAYDKPDLVLRTLEGVVGGDVMRRIMLTYFEEYRFKHPTAQDFQNVCEEVSGSKLGWFFSQFIYGSETADFAVESIDYYRETDLSTGASNYITRVVVARNGGVKMPVDLRLSLSDGSAEDTVWNGQNRWQAFTFRSNASPDYAVLDPSNKIPLDTDYANNSLRVHAFLTPVIKWAGKIVSYFQNILLNIGLLA